MSSMTSRLIYALIFLFISIAITVQQDAGGELLVNGWFTLGFLAIMCLMLCVWNVAVATTMDIDPEDDDDHDARFADTIYYETYGMSCLRKELSDIHSNRDIDIFKDCLITLEKRGYELAMSKLN